MVRRVPGPNVVGPAFLLNAVGGAVIAVLLLTWRSWVPPLLAVGFGVATLGAFVIATTVGLFGVHEHWVGGYVWTAAIAEVVAIVGAARCCCCATARVGSAGQLQHRLSVRRAHLH